MSSEPEQGDEMTLENLCVDCLVEIFSYLSLRDLLNVADSSENLKIAAGLAFSLEYGKTIFRLDGFTSRIRNFYHTTFMTADLKFMFQLIRCFGHLVSRMEVILEHDYIDDMKLLDTNFEHLIFYVKEYCIDSLTEFTLLGVDLKGSSLHHFVNPFPNVHSVCVQSPVTKTISLTKLFPKMRRLTFHCEKMEELLSIRSDLQNLDHLEINTDNVWERWDPLLQQSVSQLQSLSLSFCAIFSSTFSFDSFLNLQELKLNSMPRYIEYKRRFHVKTVKKFSLDDPSHFISSFPVIPFSFDNLEILDLHFSANNTTELKSSPEPLYDFISRHPTISKLRIYNVPGLLSLHRLMNALPLLEDVELIGVLDVNDIIQFMNEMKALKIFIIISYRGHPKNPDIAVINDRLKVQWHCEKFNALFYKFTRISKC